MGVDQVLFRQVMSRFASGVTVVTTATGDQPVGLTVSSFTSLSLAPTLVLICIAEHATSYSAIVEAGQFAVNILAEDQAEVSRRFASLAVDKFVADSYRWSERGLPLLLGTLATLECQVVNQFPGGDHAIFVGEVLAASMQAEAGRPLVYYRAGYHQLGETVS